MFKSALFALTAAAFAFPAAAQVTELQNSNPMPKGNDPSAQICERIQKTGSRLATATVCMTAQEWKDVRMGQRQDVEKRQHQVVIPYRSN